METDNEAAQDGKLTLKMVTPAAITFALVGLLLVASSLDGRSLDSQFFSGVSLISLSVLAPACIGRASTSIPLNSGTLRTLSISIALLIFSIVANLVSPDPFNHMFIFTFVLVGFASAALNESRRFEESAVFLTVVLGLRLAALYSSGLEISQDSTSAMIDIQRASIGSSFFSFWFASISLGVLIAISLRGSTESRGNGSLFSAISLPTENKEVLIYSSLIFAGFLAPLVWIGQLESLEEFAKGSHLGVVWAIFSCLVVLLHSFFRSEGWHVLGSMLAVNWALYTIGHLHEIGNELPSLFSEDGFVGSFSWFFLGFWLNFFAIFFASRGIFGDIAPSRERSGFRVWWELNSYPLMIAIAFIVALVVRTAWNVIPAMNASGTGLWDMTGGSDPWYMKRVVDFVIAERSHLIYDHDRSYPSGGINPRPPLFSWTLALGALALSWVLEIAPEEAVWWSMSALPAIYGAMIVIPVAGIASRVHSRSAGIFAAWLIALMPGHMSRSTFAMSDHDSFAMLFLAIAFYFWIRAVENVENKNVFESASRNPLYIIAGMRETWKTNPVLMANATMSGIAFSVMALGWKGFVYGPGILFLAYSFQVVINIFRGRDSLQFTSAALQMMITSILIPVPFYAWPGMNLLFAPSGMQPMLYIIGFTFAVGWVSSSFRDKPWLLVVMGGSALFGSILALLYLLQIAEVYAGWDILFTGGFYFSKNKIFGTIGEAQAPDRGVLFASYGPIVALIAIGCSFVLLWRGSRKSKADLTLLGLWTIIATYMAWTAGRFIINATPAMAVAGGIGISMLWSGANFPAFTKVWRNSGIGTPRTRFRSIWPASKSKPGVPAMILVILLITSQHTTYGIDSGIPRGEEAAYEIDESIYNIAPDILRQDFFNLFSIMNSDSYDPAESGLWYMGTFGPSFNSQGWNQAYDWLSKQDSDIEFSQRPAFVSWWDYGFQALSSGQHPTVADNFQSGIPNSGALLLSAGQEDTLSLFIATLAMGDRKINGGGLTDDFISVISESMSPEQVVEFEEIITNNDLDFLRDRSMSLVAEYGNTDLLKGKMLDEEGIPLDDEFWVVIKDGDKFGEATTNRSEALSLFDEARGSSSSYDLNEDNPTHYDLAGYRYTNDLFVDYYDVSTALHRANANFGLMRAFLITAFDLGQLVQIYDGISSIDSYEVSDYGLPYGETAGRNHEIRYFAVDNKLFPLGGKYYADYSGYHRGQTTGIFHAPTHLSGLDIDTYITTTYETNQGMMTPQEYQDQYMQDLRSQASGATTAEDMIAMTDIDYQHTSAFFDTMVARTYVGYGTSTLGLPSPGGQLGDADSPSSWIAPNFVPGSPGSYLEGALALPGAMMNHFVLSNWYDPDDGSGCERIEISGTASTSQGSSTLTNVTLSSDASLLSGWGQIQSGGPWNLSSSSQDSSGPIPGIMDVINHDSEEQTITLNSPASSTVEEIVLTISGQMDKYCGTEYDSNRLVKILKYYSGATLEGTVSLDGIGPVPNARILIERDAFSGEENADEFGNVVDRDSRTFWIPIGSTQSDQEGRFSFIVPSGKIRISAFTGDPDIESGRSAIMTGMGSAMYELLSESSTNRNINPVTGILGNVYGSTWLSETIVNVSGEDGHSNGKSVIAAPISVLPSSATGLLSWSGEPDFDGEPVVDAQVILTPVSDEVSITPYSAPTSNGTMVGESLYFTGTGEVTLFGDGRVVSDGAVSVKVFTGSHTQKIYDNHSIVGDGEFTGIGILVGSISGDVTSCQDGQQVPTGFEACMIQEGEYALNGSINGSGRFTSQGISEYTRDLYQATFVGSGTFETNSSIESDSGNFGTINGSGTFSGNGSFSGPMVSSGTFHIVDALPGEYTVSVDFGGENIVLLTDTFTIPLSPSEAPSPVSIFGGSIKGTVSMHSGDPLESPIEIYGINGSSDNATTECGLVIVPPCFALPDENGSFEVSPVIPGSYLASVDIDDDGFPEIRQEFIFSPEQASLASFPSTVPKTSDLSFSLSDDGASVDGLELILRPENQSLSQVIALFDNQSKTYSVELLPGTWIMNYTLSEDKQLWERIEVGEDDSTGQSYQFRVSQSVNGSILFKPGFDSQEGQSGSPAAFKEVEFQWSGFSLTTTSDSNGDFSIVLPMGAHVNATSESTVGSGGLLSNGTRFVVSEDMGPITIELIESSMVFGSVSFNREGNAYNQAFKDWKSVHAIANNLDGSSDSVWREEVDELGKFDMLLPLGNWSFTLDAGEMASSSEIKTVNDSESSDVELLIISDPNENSTVVIDFYIDHEGDNNATNGTPVSYPFEIIPLTSNGSGLSVELEDSSWISTGSAQVSLEPGKYRIVVERANASLDDPFDTLYDTNEIFDVGLDSSTIERSIGFEPLWLLNITLRNESDQRMVNHIVKLQNTENNWIQTFTTDENGTIADYVQEGEWIVIVDEFETNNGVFEGLRSLISVNQSTAGFRNNLRTGQLAEFTVTLNSSIQEEYLESLELVIESQDGMGSFIVSHLGFTEPVLIRTTPGNWNIRMNQTDENGVRLLLENSSLADSGVSAGSEHQVTKMVEYLVLASGKVFWDLNDDGNAGVFEGLPNATVSFSLNNSGNSSSPAFSTKSSSTGAWSTFLPVQSIWNVSVELEGFETENSSLEVAMESVSKDIEISAGEVEISGQITYLDQTCVTEGEWQITLIPPRDFSRERVSATRVENLDSSGFTGEWTASVEPGTWIVYAITTGEMSSTECQGLVSIESIDVGVDGGTIDSEFAIGGNLDLDTKWLDFQGVEKELQDLDALPDPPDYDLFIEIGNLAWLEELDSEGHLRMLLPAGLIQASSKFVLPEGGRNVTYSGGKGFTIRSGQESPIVTLNIERESKQDIVISTVSGDTVSVAKQDPSCTEGCTYQNAEFTLRADYDGHNSFDSYRVSGTVPGMDGLNWKVEFENGTGNWNESLSFDMGLDNEIYKSIKIRVTPANSSLAHHFPDGHRVLLKFSTNEGYSTQSEVKVKIPAIRGFEMTNPDTLYFGPDETTVSIEIPFKNLGNADEVFSFEFETPDGWDLTGPLTQPSSPFSDGIATFTLVKKPLHQFPSQYAETIRYNVTDQSNNSYFGESTLILDSPSLSIVGDGDSLRLLGGKFAEFGEIETYSVIVSNSGNVAAKDVTLLATLCEDIRCETEAGVNFSATADVDSQNQTTFYMEMDYTQFQEAKNFFILFQIVGEDIGERSEPCGTQAAEGKPSCVEEAQLWAASEENENLKYMAYVFVILLIAALLFFTKRPGRRVSAPF